MSWGIGGYTLYEVQEKLASLQRVAGAGPGEHSGSSMSRLAATGTDVSKTLEDLKAQVSTNFTEIDKLWAMSPIRQNKPDISRKTCRAIAGLKRRPGSARDRVNGRIGQARCRSQNQAIARRRYRDLREGLLQDNEELITEVALLRGQVQDQAVAQEATKRNVNALDRKMKETQEAIASIDAHRGQLSQKLNELQNEIQSGTSPIQ